MANPFAHIKDADYEVLEDSFTSALAKGLDWLTKGNKGLIATEALTHARFAKNPDQFRQFYIQNSRAIDGYFEFIDVSKLATTLVEQGITESPKTTIQRHIPAVIVGGILGAGIATLILKRRKK